MQPSVTNGALVLQCRKQPSWDPDAAQVLLMPSRQAVARSASEGAVRSVSVQDADSTACSAAMHVCSIRGIVVSPCTRPSLLIVLHRAVCFMCTAIRILRS